MQEKIICFLIDDDDDDQEIFALALGSIDTDIHCITANDGIEALNKLNIDSDFIPDFIFLDLNMVRMNGRECLTEIRKLPRLNETPVIIYSTSSEEKDITETKLLGATDYIVKPPSISILIKRLEQVLRGRIKTI
ncbi:Response regulator receiver domain-containing protein [Chitinophaga sp. YR627]|uniref:response regulator n=1 Tax=Chitinophaga sp. YR627 TaxID=1881041 RepID=UPI0008EE4510|nr:response regulator [Chitinophaga sp. YR627]SFN00086.1 Response regulator receiver domain-containing protein [Chitinophaga sp. YR627]